MKVAKIYGTIKLSKEKRIIRKHKMYTVRRNKKGQFETLRKWSPKKPNRPETKEYREMYAHAKETKGLLTEIEKTQKKYEWTEYEDLCYDKITGTWIPCPEK